MKKLRQTPLHLSFHHFSPPSEIHTTRYSDNTKLYSCILPKKGLRIQHQNAFLIPLFATRPITEVLKAGPQNPAGLLKSYVTDYGKYRVQLSHTFARSAKVFRS
jgi:DNA-binding GntR family transcriptional regulator